MHQTLQDFLLAKSGEPFRYGHCDCALLVADWWQANHGLDPAAHLRGAYSDEAECAALLRREGGVLRLVARLARSVGAARVPEPFTGCFGVVRYNGRHLAGIATDSGQWALKGQGMLITRLCRPVAVWSL